MAFNQASFFLFAPGIIPEVAYDHDAKTISGKPLAMISGYKSDPDASKVFTVELRQWLMDRHFREKERYSGHQSLYRGQRTTFLGVQEEIELGLPLDEDEVQELYVRFLLTDRVPEHLHEWRDLVVELGHDFGFQLMDEDYQLLPCLDFTVVLAQNWNFRSFQKQYNWKL